ncbi:MAG: hypothetical protein ABI399_12015 [Bauldia sp.]
MTLAGDTVFTVADGVEISAVPDGYLVYQAKAERVHYLNPTAVVVYELAAAGKAVAAIEEFLKDAFGLSEAPSEPTRSCLESLVKEGLIWPGPSSSAP